jgi:hypothetical protein
MQHPAQAPDAACACAAKTGPFIKLGPLRNVAGVAERSGCLSAAGLVVILTVALTIYGAAAFQGEPNSLGVKTLSGRELSKDPLQARARSTLPPAQPSSPLLSSFVPPGRGRFSCMQAPAPHALPPLHLYTGGRRCRAPAEP